MSSAPQFGDRQPGLTGGFQDFSETFNRYANCARPYEFVAMILGFIFYWPVGLAILAFKIWRRKAERHGGLAFASPFAPGQAFGCRSPRTDRRSAWAARQWSAAATGNSAFDEWRNTELARIEEELQKLVASQREFETHLENLRRAKDREEFDSFMNARRAAQSSPGMPPQV